MNHIERPDSISHYKILDTLGRGSMGIVYLAEDSRLKRKVAIKCLYKQQSDALLERLRREAKVLAKLNHPNVVKIYDVVDQEDGFALVMEYVGGRSLRHYLKENHLSQRQQLALLVQILDGIAAAHSEGIIHRDLKLDNILIDAHGRAKIGDFGIAKHQSGDTVELTKHNNISGSLAAMSPEQIRGDKLSPASDVFSFGILAWQILRDCHPFEADSDLLKVEKILNSAAPSLADHSLPAGFSECLDRCLERDPNKRPSDIPGLIRNLKSFVAQLSDEIDDPTLTVYGNRFRSSSDYGPWFKLAGFLGALLLFVFVCTEVYRWAQPKPKAVYVAVLPTKLTASDDLNYDDVKKTVNYALQEGVIDLEGIFLIPTQEVEDYLGEEDQLFSALGADGVLSSELSCRNFRCDLHLFLKNSSGDKLKINDHIVDHKLLEIYRLTQLNLAELFPGREGLLALSDVIRESDYSEYVRLNAFVQESESNYAEVVFELQALIARAPNFEPLYELLIKIGLDQYSETKDEKLMEAIFKSLEIAEDSKINRNKLRLLRVEALAELGQADRAWNEISLLEEGFGDAREIYVLKGIVEEKRENYRAAIAHFQAANELRPSVRSYRDTAINYWFLGNVDEAIATLKKALKINPRDIHAGLSLATFYMTKGQIDKAEELYLRYESRSQIGTTLSNLGLIYMLKRDYKKAEKYFLLSAEKKKDNRSWYLNLADNYLLQGDMENAKKNYEFAIEDLREKRDSKSLALLAQAYIHTGLKKQALEALRGAKKISPNNSDILYAEAIIYTKLSDYPSALIAVEKSIEMGLGKVWFLLSWFDPICNDSNYRAQFIELTANTCSA
ncbi:serine/threonine-protein kinase [uncultured Pseudoteredinibacter sp.]|uniref:serine/threonine-protein kinase n=1 Tax=uncultured Pseudoteredinibacter sp. TaxID=1641701 RepID=UPI00260C1BE5|nr:serine/threonine-protein kinase [uncultured Pseudoteredinibacter sp.]